MSEFQAIHKPVLLNECIENISCLLDNIDNEPKTLVDCNLGEGGHSQAFLQRFSKLNIIGLDCDADIIQRAKTRLEGLENRITFVKTWSSDYLEEMKSESADVIFFDFGISMYHYKSDNRGFSFSKDERLDMRLDKEQILSAYDVVNSYREEELSNLIYRYSDEKKSRKIAKKIVEVRRLKKIETTYQLHDIVSSCFSPSERRLSNTDVATRTFQAIRIEVNNELERIKICIDNALRSVKINGIIMAITFHSLEDRIVKWKFRDAKQNNIVDIITNHPIVPSDDEIENNSASRSAKLRIVRRVA